MLMNNRRAFWVAGFGLAMGMPAAATAQAAAKTPAAAAIKEASLDARIAYVRRLLRNTPLVDGHNDLPWAMREAAKDPLDVVAYDLRRTTAGMTDIARLRKGMVGGSPVKCATRATRAFSWSKSTSPSA
jgi:hypothetical protein